MTHTSSPQTLLALNSTEWLNLCARGSIRLSKRRPVVVSNPVSNREMEKVFVSAPFTNINSSVDLFVLVIKDEWTKSMRGHRSFPSEILHLRLSDVMQHHPIAREHLEYYKNIGHKCGVYLAEPIFELSWVHWITNETIKECAEAAELLQHTFHIHLSSETKRADRYKWDEVARLVIRPHEIIRTKPSHIESLLSNVRRIADAASETRDSEQFYLACAIEWIEIRLDKDSLKNKTTKQPLLTALSSAKESPLGAPSEQTWSALELLTATFPKAFTDELPPVAIAHVVQLLTESRTKKLKIETVMRILHSLNRKSSTSTMITYLLASSLGIELTNQLVHALGQESLSEIDWDNPN